MLTGSFSALHAFYSIQDIPEKPDSTITMRKDSGRRGSFSYREECPIICCDGHLLACVMTKTGTYTPQLVIQRDDVIDSLRDQIAVSQKDVELIAETDSRYFSNAKDFLMPSPTRPRRNGDSPVFASPQKNDVLLRVSPSQQSKPCSNTVPCGTPNKRRTEMKYMMKWACENGDEYVSAETVNSADEAETFLDLILESKLTMMVTLKVNASEKITITYQFLPDFRQDFMIVKVNSGHCLLMRAF